MHDFKLFFFQCERSEPVVWGIKLWKRKKEHLFFQDVLMLSFKQQVMADKCCLPGRLIGVETPSVPLVFLNHLGYVLVVPYLNARPLLQPVLHL